MKRYYDATVNNHQRVTVMNRQEMIDKLVNDSINTSQTAFDGYAWLDLIFREGFVGFNNQTTEQLEMEMSVRGLTET